MIQERLDYLKNRSHELDTQIAEFTSECKSLAKELTDRLSKRRKKYRISVKLDIKFDLIRYDFDVYIDDRFYATSYPIDFDEDLDEEQILKECDRLYDEIYEK